MLSTKTLRTYRLQVNGWKKIYHVDTNQKKSGVAILISAQTSKQGTLSGIKRVNSSERHNKP